MEVKGRLHSAEVMDEGQYKLTLITICGESDLSATAVRFYGIIHESLKDFSEVRFNQIGVYEQFLRAESKTNGETNYIRVYRRLPKIFEEEAKRNLPRKELEDLLKQRR